MSGHVTKTVVALLALAGLAMGCGGQQDVSGDGPGNTTTPTPVPTDTPPPTPQGYTIHFVSLHIYDPGDTIGNGDAYWTFALNDTVRYSNQISISGQGNYNPEDFGVTGIDFVAVDGDPVYIYADGYDIDPLNNHTPLGTVNTGWYAGTPMVGRHTVAAENPYHYDLTYEVVKR